LADGFATGGFANKAFSSRYRRQYTIDLVAHMAECDLNYERLMRLFPEVHSQDQRCISLLGESPQTSQSILVELTVIERSRYTTLIQLVQRPQLSWGRSPNMRIRMYHDAKSAEVVEYQHQNRFHGSYEVPNRRMRQRDEKAQLNQFLGEYLRYCLAVGGVMDVSLEPGG
tara:strand:+ start:1995 stop:2504 length:510 start_codon:yes stop_codon:yes gene_type:complete